MLKGYTIDLIKQVGEIPLQLAHHRLHSRSPGKPKKVKFGKHFRQYMLLWIPGKDAPQTNSIVFYVHGGGWRVGAPYLHPGIPRFFLDLGYPIVMPAYRLAPFYRHAHMREDMDLALKVLLETKRNLGLPQEKILVGGMSAGATLAAHLAYDRTALDKIGLSQKLFSGYLGMGSPLDLDEMPNLLPMRLYSGGKPDSKAWQIANPLTYLESDENLPTLLTHSETDAIVPYKAARSFYDKFPNPKRIELHHIKGRTHLDSLRFAIDDMESAEQIRQWLKSNSI